MFGGIIFQIWIFASMVSGFVEEDIPQSIAVTADNFHYQGVALGGWLVLEPYITPSLFLEFNATSHDESDIPVDEYHYCKSLGKEEAEKRLQRHWSSFYNETDFADMKNYGLNMVRIPIGYWAFRTLDDDPYVSGAAEYLDKAIEWCRKHQLKVWIDLHGAPGSQNGFDNSGYRNIGYPGWQNSTENVELTRLVLQDIYERYGNDTSGTIIGIEVLNEPFSPKLNINAIKDFYIETYYDARKNQSVNNTIVFHDAFKDIGYWNDFKNRTFSDIVPIYNISATNSSYVYAEYRNTTKTSNYNILIDHHHYEVFTVEGLNSTMEEHISSIKSYTGNIRDYELDVHPAIVGEWSAALTDCTPWLNGVGLGSRYEGQAPYDNEKLGNCSEINNWNKWTSQQKKNYRKWIEIQLDQYSNNTLGWIFWCYKTETTIEWDFKKLVDLQLMPQPLNDRKYIINGTDTDKKKNNAVKSTPSFYIIFFVVLFMII